MKRFIDKVVIVSGGGTGIGRAAVEAVLAEGGSVVVTGRREAPLKALRDEHPDAVRYVAGDIAAPGVAKRVVDHAVAEFGGVDVVINNAGIGLLGPLVEASDEAIDLTLGVNVKGVLVLTREALPQLQKRGGAVVNISSTVADFSMAGSALYAGTKAAVNRITAALAVELGPLGIRVNAVAPGLTITAMSEAAPQEMLQGMVAQTPLGRAGKPEDIARSIVFLASDDASWVTGQVLQSSGGLML